MALRVARLLVLGAGLAAITAIVTTSLDREAYFFYRDQDRTQWEYPSGGVAFVVVMTALETAIAYAVFAVQKPGRVWMRALGGLGLLIPWNLLASQFVVHAPGFWLLHLLWLWLLIAIVALAVLISGMSHLYSWRRARGTADG
jgi:hypothetical protein